MLQTLLIWVVFATFLPPPTIQRCFKANESQCASVDFTPGSDLAGEGFDITTMQRKGAFVIDMSSWLQKDKTCTLCKNPYMGGQTQKLPVSVVDWRPSRKCTSKLSSSVYESSEALVTASTSSVENNWKSDLQIRTPKVQGSLMLAGSNSKLADYSMEKTKKDKFSFTSHDFSCGYYRYRVSNRPLINPELIQEFGSLPKIYDESSKHSYFNLIDKFGTHYITKVTLGGSVRSVTSIMECQASLQGLSVDEVKTCLDVEASVSMGIASLNTEAHHCNRAKDKSLHKKTFSSSFTDRETTVTGGHTQIVDLLFSSSTDPKAYKEWVSSLPAHPDVLSYSLVPLHHLLLPPANRLIKANLRNAIKDYILQRGLLKNCTSRCKTGVNTNPKEPCKCTCHNNPGVALNCCPTQRGAAEITITVIRATGLWGDYFGQTDGYVKLISKEKASQTHVIWNNNSPTWNYQIPLGIKDITVLRTVKLEVWDKDSGWDDDLLGTCTVQLISGKKTDICPLNHGLLYYKVEVKCVPSLAGPDCMKYQPSPMEAELEKVYVSRHARPIPRGILLEMGVLIDERMPRFNQSNIPKAAGLEL